MPETPVETGRSRGGKRPAETSASDEMQCIASNPTKKRRLTHHQDGVAPPSAPRPASPQAAPAERRRRGQQRTSRLSWENFVFPQSFPRTSSRSSRRSEAISPKQLPAPAPAGDQPPRGVQGPRHAPATAVANPSLDPDARLAGKRRFDANLRSPANGAGPATGSMRRLSPPPFLSKPATAVPFANSTRNSIPLPHMHSGRRFWTSPASRQHPRDTHHNHVQSFHSLYPAFQPVQARFQRPNMPPAGPFPATRRGAPCAHCERIQKEILRQSQPPVSAPASRLPPPATPVFPPQHEAEPQTHRRLQTTYPAAAPRPTLAEDIAQTVRATFPYATVAARHGITPAGVSEVVARWVAVLAAG